MVFKIYIYYLSQKKIASVYLNMRVLILVQSNQWDEKNENGTFFGGKVHEYQNIFDLFQNK